jgi:hypothetical protein
MSRLAGARMDTHTPQRAAPFVTAYVETVCKVAASHVRLYVVRLLWLSRFCFVLCPSSRCVLQSPVEVFSSRCNAKKPTLIDFVFDSLTYRSKSSRAPTVCAAKDPDEIHDRRRHGCARYCRIRSFRFVPCAVIHWICFIKMFVCVVLQIGCSMSLPTDTIMSA